MSSAGQVCHVCVSNAQVRSADVDMFLRGSTVLNKNNVKKKIKV